MRDYIHEQAAMRDRTFVFPKLHRLLGNWRARRQLQNLLALDDYMLGDIGLTREDVRFGLKLPLDIDPIAEIVRVRNVELVRGRRSR